MESIEYIERTLNAIRHGYPYRIKHYNNEPRVFVVVNNPSFEEDNGEDVHLVIEASA